MTKFKYTQAEILETLNRFECKVKEFEQTNPERLLSAASWGVRCVDLHAPESNVGIAYQMVSSMVQDFCTKGFLPKEDTDCVFFSEEEIKLGLVSDPNAVNDVVGLYHTLKAM